MISPASNPSIDCQLLSPAKVEWILDVSPRTLDNIIAQRAIEVFKVERLNRIHPDGLTRYLLRVRRSAKGTPLFAQACGAGPGLDEETWARIQRLIEAVVESRLRKEAA